MSLERTSALVTGGASGMGEATGRRLAAEGAHVVVVDRDATRGAAIATDLGGTFCEADVTQEEPVRVAVAAATEHSPLRTCIHFAGVGRADDRPQPQPPPSRTPPQDHREQPPRPPQPVAARR